MGRWGVKTKGQRVKTREAGRKGLKGVSQSVKNKNERVKIREAKTGGWVSGGGFKRNSKG